MKLLVSIGKINHFQEKGIEKLKEKLDIEISYDQNEPCDMILTTSWHETFDHKNLKALFVPYTGLNRFPVKELEKRGVRVINTHAKAKLVAERALSLCLTLMGKVMIYHQAMKEGRWMTREGWGQELWYSLQNKRVAIIGMGHIGREIINFLKPYNCEILNLERDRSKDLAAGYYDLNNLLIHADVVFLACELNDETRYLINKSNIHLLKDSFLINISRGDVIEEEALYMGVKDYLLGAGIDVWYQYPKDGMVMPSKYPIHTFENIVMSPHASCHAKAFRDAYYEDIVLKIENYVREND